MRSVTHRMPGFDVTEHTFEIPLDHANPDGERITVFARDVSDPDGGQDKPYLVYFQGGPGHEATRPSTGPRGPGWLDRALHEYRVLLLDQRGTGRSTPVSDLPGRTPREQAEYLAFFRADSIVADAEWIRRELDVDRWSVLGQSFGGFCVMRYLSVAPDSLREAFVTGGLAPLGGTVAIDDIYRATFVRMLERTRRYYQRYPEDRERVLSLHAHLESSDVRLPSGDRLTGRRLRQLGLMLGFSYGFEALHSIIELPFDSFAFLHDVEAGTAFSRNPLYVLLNESCYGDGFATRWASARVMPEEYAASPELFTGEHMFPWMTEDYRALAPLREAADLLAEREWPVMYDPAQLAANEVPAAAAIYEDDIYVERAFSVETAAAIRGMRPWITNEHEHNGLRADGHHVLGRLIDLVRGRA